MPENEEELFLQDQAWVLEGDSTIMKHAKSEEAKDAADGSDVELYYILHTPEESLVEVDERHGVARKIRATESTTEAVNREPEHDTPRLETDNESFLQTRVTGGLLEADSMIMEQAKSEEGKEAVDGLDVEPYYLFLIHQQKMASAELREPCGVARETSGTESTAEESAEVVRRGPKAHTRQPEIEEFFIQPRVTGGILEADSMIIEQAKSEEGKEAADGLDVEPYYLLLIPQQKMASAELRELLEEARGTPGTESTAEGSAEAVRREAKPDTRLPEIEEFFLQPRVTGGLLEAESMIMEQAKSEEGKEAVDLIDVEPYYLFLIHHHKMASAELREPYGVARETPGAQSTAEESAEVVRREPKPDTRLPELEEFFLQPRVTGGLLEAESMIMEQAKSEEGKEAVDGFDVEPYYLFLIHQQKMASAELREPYGVARETPGTESIAEESAEAVMREPKPHTRLPELEELFLQPRVTGGLLEAESMIMERAKSEEGKEAMDGFDVEPYYLFLTHQQKMASAELREPYGVARETIGTQSTTEESAEAVRREPKPDTRLPEIEEFFLQPRVTRGLLEAESMNMEQAKSEEGEEAVDGLDVEPYYLFLIHQQKMASAELREPYGVARETPGTESTAEESAEAVRREPEPHTQLPEIEEFFLQPRVTGGLLETESMNKEQAKSEEGKEAEDGFDVEPYYLFLIHQQKMASAELREPYGVARETPGTESTAEESAEAVRREPEPHTQLPEIEEFFLQPRVTGGLLETESMNKEQAKSEEGKEAEDGFDVEPYYLFLIHQQKMASAELREPYAVARETPGTESTAEGAAGALRREGKPDTRLPEFEIFLQPRETGGLLEENSSTIMEQVQSEQAKAAMDGLDVKPYYLYHTPEGKRTLFEVGELHGEVRRTPGTESRTEEAKGAVGREPKPDTRLPEIEEFFLQPRVTGFCLKEDSPFMVDDESEEGIATMDGSDVEPYYLLHTREEKRRLVEVGDLHGEARSTPGTESSHEGAAGVLKADTRLPEIEDDADFTYRASTSSKANDEITNPKENLSVTPQNALEVELGFVPTTDMDVAINAKRSHSDLLSTPDGQHWPSAQRSVLPAISSEHHHSSDVRPLDNTREEPPERMEPVKENEDGGGKSKPEETEDMSHKIHEQVSNDKALGSPANRELDSSSSPLAECGRSFSDTDAPQITAKLIQKKQSGNLLIPRISEDERELRQIIQSEIKEANHNIAEYHKEVDVKESAEGAGVTTTGKDEVPEVERRMSKPHLEVQVSDTRTVGEVSMVGNTPALTDREVLEVVSIEKEPSSQPMLLAAAVDEVPSATSIAHKLPVSDQHIIQSDVAAAERTLKTAHEAGMAEARNADETLKEASEQKHASDETTAEKKAPLAITRDMHPVVSETIAQREGSSSLTTTTDHDKSNSREESDDFLPEGIPDPVAGLAGFFKQRGSAQTTHQHPNITLDGSNEKHEINNGTEPPGEQRHLSEPKRELGKYTAVDSKEAIMAKVDGLTSPLLVTEKHSRPEDSSAASHERGKLEGHKSTEVPQAEEKHITEASEIATEANTSPKVVEMAMTFTELNEHKPRSSAKEPSSEEIEGRQSSPAVAEEDALPGAANAKHDKEEAFEGCGKILHTGGENHRTKGVPSVAEAKQSPREKDVIMNSTEVSQQKPSPSAEAQSMEEFGGSQSLPASGGAVSQAHTFKFTTPTRTSDYSMMDDLNAGVVFTTIKSASSYGGIPVRRKEKTDITDEQVVYLSSVSSSPRGQLTSIKKNSSCCLVRIADEDGEETSPTTVKSRPASPARQYFKANFQQGQAVPYTGKLPEPHAPWKLTNFLTSNISCKDDEYSSPSRRSDKKTGRAEQDAQVREPYSESAYPSCPNLPSERRENVESDISTRLLRAEYSHSAVWSPKISQPHHDSEIQSLLRCKLCGQSFFRGNPTHAEMCSSYHKDAAVPAATSGVPPTPQFLEKYVLSVVDEDDVSDVLRQAWRDGETAILAPAVWSLYHCAPSFFYIIRERGKRPTSRGDVCASACVITFGDEVSFCGFFHVSRERDNAGLSRTLWNRMLDACQGKNVCTAMPQERALPFLDRYHFLVSYWGDIIYCHVTLRGGSFPAPSASRDGVHVRDLDLKRDSEAVIQYDHGVFGFDRSYYLRVALAEKEQMVKVATVTSSEGRLVVVGYVGVQTDQRGRPALRWLFADGDEAALALMHAVVEACPKIREKGLVGAFYASSHATGVILKSVDKEFLEPWTLLYNKREPFLRYDKIVSLTLI
ncbi:hypothetical protein MTO96_000349 [Rhipicephalus appendiculatus]